MSMRQKARRDARPAGTARSRGPALLIAVVAALAVLAAVVVVWPALQSGGGATPATPGVPAPIGGPSVAMDVGTLIGKPAPSLTLSDSEGKSYTVSPGQGRPLVLVSHMGIT